MSIADNTEGKTPADRHAMSAFLLLAVFLAGALPGRPVSAQSAPQLSLPVDCTVGHTCHIQHYVDHDPGPGARDFSCGGLTYDAHKGTDFRLATLADMDQGVPVLAAAPGRVSAARDGMADRIYRSDTETEVAGRECGNGVVIDHGDGWETQYCHLRRGSVAVRPGEMIRRGTPLGEIGISGKSQFPHLHLSVRHAGRVVDPFAPDADDGSCGPRTDPGLWLSDLPYRPAALLSVAFAPGIPGFDRITVGRVPAPTASSSAMVLYGFAIGGRARDTMRLVIEAPNGTVLLDETLPVEKAQAQFFRAAGKRLKTPRWPPGTYTGRVELIREGAILDRRTATHELK